MNKQEKVDKLMAFIKEMRLQIFIEHLKTILTNINENLHEVVSKQYYKQVELFENIFSVVLESNYIQKLSDREIDIWIADFGTSTFEQAFRPDGQNLTIVMIFVNADLAKKRITDLDKKI